VAGETPWQIQNADSWNHAVWPSFAADLDLWSCSAFYLAALQSVAQQPLSAEISSVAA